MARPTSNRSRVAVFAASGLLVGLGLGLLVAVGGCEEQASTPPQGNQGGLSQSPDSLLGRSAKTAKDVAQQAENQQARAANAADQLTGQAGTEQVAGLSWSVPSDWRKAPPASAFVSVEYRVDGDAGEARMTISKFGGGSGGSIDQNIQRWEAQFRDDAGGSVPAYPTERTIAGCKVTLVSLEGTMRGGTPGGPPADTPDTSLRGALIEGPEGLVVVKLTGPTDTVKGVDGEWDRMIQGMTRTGR